MWDWLTEVTAVLGGVFLVIAAALVIVGAVRDR